MKSMLLRVIAGVAVGLLVLGLGGLGMAKLLGISVPFQTHTTDRSQPVLLKSIQELKQYHAAVGTFQVIVDVKDDVDWVPDFLAGERSLFVAAGTVNAYVDFSGFAEGDLRLSEDGKSVTIRLPAAKLDKPNLDFERSYIFSQERGALNRLKDAFATKDQQRLYALAEAKIAAAAKESELLKQADENAKANLSTTLNAVGIKAIFAEASLRGR